jgi:uncharacterized membrane protein YdfJ with MMPL/SSD domain
MRRLQRVISRNQITVGVIWLVVLAISVPLAANQGNRLTTGGFAVSGSQSQAVQRAWQQSATTMATRTDTGVLVRAGGAIDANSWHQLLIKVRRDIAQAGGQIAPGRHPQVARANRHEALIPLVSATGDTEHGQRLAKRLAENFESDRYPRGKATVIGQGAVRSMLDERANADLAQAELISAPVLLIILILVFGSLSAALLPLMLGGISVLVTGAAIALLSRQFEMSVFVTNVASMIGIGVAVDYALFIVTRYREARARGVTPDDARREAMSTSGLAVVFSGTTVIFAVSALWLTDTAATRSMALGATVVVVVAVLACVTLLPLLLVQLAERRTRWTKVSPSPLWQAVVRVALRRPAFSASAACLLMLALAAPALAMSTSEGLLRYFGKTDQIQQATRAAAHLAGPGALAPVEVVLRSNGREPEASPTAPKRTVAALRSQPGVYRVKHAEELGSGVLVRAALRTDSESPAAKGQVKDIRKMLKRIEPAGTEVLVGGVTAEQIDLEEHVAHSAPWIALFVAIVTYLVLLVLTRSLLLPLKALAMTFLTAAAGYGVIVVFFQWGWFEWLGVQAVGDVDLLTPLLMLTVVVGLSMDYEVFLLSRIRERYLAGLAPRDAIEEGVVKSARTITSAALIMVCVFAVFVATGVSTVQQLGLGLAVAIGLDATVVRMVLLPASMQLLGRWNWWMPGWLQRILPTPTSLGAPEAA